MRFLVVDSNVLVVANGRDSNASPACRLKTIQALKAVLENEGIILDQGGEMFEEYRRYCSPSGQPGLGDLFLREVLFNYSNKIKRIELPKDEDGQFLDFPEDPELSTFDPSDRKFAAAARKESAPVVNSTDTDWLQHLKPLKRNGIKVDFLCGCSSETWFQEHGS